MLEEWSLLAALLVATLFLWIYFKVKTAYSYFEKRGIPYVKPHFLLGSDIRLALGRDCMGVSYDRIYKALKGEKVGGFYLGLIPNVMVQDPEYINKMLTSNFENFHDRPLLIDEKTNPLEAHLFFLKGNKWRFLRHKLTPVFTPGKIKYMFGDMFKCSENLIEYLDKQADGRDMDLHEILAKFSTDVIGSTAFGLEPEALNNPKSKLRAMGKRFFSPTFKIAIMSFMKFALPRFTIAMKIRTTDRIVSDYFLSTFRQVFEHRRKTSVTRKDFVQLCLQLKELGHIEIDAADLDNEPGDAYNDKKTIEDFEITDELLAAQSFGFFLGGFETVSGSLNFLVYMLSLDKDIQDKAREEVRRVKQKYGSFSYEALKDMTYLDKCISETLRLYPPVTFLFRECTKDFTFPDGTRIEKGVSAAIPILSLHRDPKYFPNPEEFRPERFETPPVRGTYAPFGDGPRMCIGKRFAMVEMKMVAANLLDRFQFDESHLTKKPVQFAVSLTLNPLNPLLVKMSKCQDQHENH